MTRRTGTSCGSRPRPCRHRARRRTSRPGNSSSTRCCGGTRESARPRTTTRSSTKSLEGVDLVIAGHTPALWPTWTRRNVVSLDTGAHYEGLGHLTVAEIQDGLTLHRFARTETFAQRKTEES